MPTAPARADGPRPGSGGRGAPGAEPAAAAPPLVLVRGDEPLLVDRAIQRSVAAAHRADPATERREATAAGLSPGEFADLVAPSLFAEPRAVVVRGAHEAAKDLAAAIEQYATSPVDGVTLIVQHAGGARNKALLDALARAGAAVIECARITRVDDRIQFVRHEIKAAGGTTTAAAAAALVDAVGNDLAELASAAGQLVADTGGMVDDATVRRYYRGRAEVSGFAVADLAVAGNVPAALEALRWALLVGEHPVRIADALATGVRGLAKVAGAGAGDAYRLASELRMPRWKVEKMMRPARQWSANGLTRAMELVARLNADVKGGAADSSYALERAVIGIGRARRER